MFLTKSEILLSGERLWNFIFVSFRRRETQQGNLKSRNVLPCLASLDYLPFFESSVNWNYRSRPNRAFSNCELFGIPTLSSFICIGRSHKAWCHESFRNAGSLRSQRRHNDHNVKCQKKYVVFVVVRGGLSDLLWRSWLIWQVRSL